MRSLVELALAINEKERVPESANPVVKKALEKHRAEREEAASNDIVSLLRKIEEHKLVNRRSIRQLKARLKEAKAALDDLDRRWEYAQQTSNFLPVLKFFNAVVPHDLANPADFDGLTSVPADWLEDTPTPAGE